MMLNYDKGLIYDSGQILDKVETNINERVKYTANTIMAYIGTANSNLDGSGTLGDLVVGASNGTLIKTVTIKATGETTPQGMIRFFVFTPGYYCLIKEIEIPMVLQSGTDKTFSINLNLNFVLKTNYTFKVSTEKANNFSIISQGLDYTYT